MKRRVFTLASALSLLICVTSSVLWSRSNQTQDYAIKGTSGPNTLYICSERGWLSITTTGSILKVKGEWIFNSIPFAAVTAFRPSIGVRWTVPPALVRVPGFALRRINGLMVLPGTSYLPSSPIQSLRIISVHWAWPTVLAGIPPLIWLARWIRTLKRRIRPGCCPRCRYDLTANTSGVCPECGTPVAGTAKVEPATAAKRATFGLGHHPRQFRKTRTPTAVMILSSPPDMVEIAGA